MTFFNFQKVCDTRTDYCDTIPNVDPKKWKIYILFGPPIKSPFLARGLGPRAGPAGLARPGPGSKSESPARPGPKILARARSYAVVTNKGKI